MSIHPFRVLSHVLKDSQSSFSDWGEWALLADWAAAASLRVERGMGTEAAALFDLSCEQRIFSSPDLFSVNIQNDLLMEMG